MTTTPNLPVTAALMMGGISRRMGRDKADLEIGGVPLWQRQLRVLAETGAAEIVVSATVTRAGRTAGYPLLVDEVKGEGPLRALATVLRQSTQQGVLVLGVDLPGMSSEFLQQIAALGVAGEVAVVPEAENEVQALAAYYPRRCLPLIDEQLSAGNRTLHHFVRRATVEGLARLLTVSSPGRLFVNLNSPDDVARYCQADEC